MNYSIKGRRKGEGDSGCLIWIAILVLTFMVVLPSIEKIEDRLDALEKVTKTEKPTSE